MELLNSKLKMELKEMAKFNIMNVFRELRTNPIANNK